MNKDYIYMYIHTYMYVYIYIVPILMWRVQMRICRKHHARLQRLRFRAYKKDLEFSVQGSDFEVQGSGFRVHGIVFNVWSLRFNV